MNFDYLKPFPKFNKLYEYCSDAEEYACIKPSISATSSRKAMEFIVKMIYTSEVGDSFGMSVFEMITDARFEAVLNDSTLLNSIHFIRKMGNIAVHEGSIQKAEAVKVLEELHFLVGEFFIFLGLAKDYPPFEEPNERNTTSVHADGDSAENKTAQQEKKVVVSAELIAEFTPRMRATRFNVQLGRNEEENKRLFLYASLREAGWPFVNQKNQALPCSVGLNMLLDDGDSVDYVLYGRDNRPLAIVEYTETVKNIIAGRKKAIEKANKLEMKYGYKPIVYYTNGYNIYVIDQLGYPARRVFQFHAIEELELLKLRATIRQDISAPTVDANIAGRYYQKEAIENSCKAFANMRRHSLLVMATGTGKTRVAIALSDVLMRANWVKNILFLADRTSLVRQAHKNFNKLLPNVTTSIYSGGSMNRDENARIIFSTYQTMINLIDDDTREFGIGRFDLIIIDEAHRSIFKKYSALFHYFDALMIGLTATPRAEDNKSTYEMFGLENGHPDYCYELEKAISDKYLVGFSVLDRTTDVLRRGIHYDELSSDEKEKFEDTFATGDSEDGPAVGYQGTVVDAKEMRKARYINLGTIDAMFNDLMKNGLKIDGGDKLGKTIIFSSSHMEAEKIVERFQILYPYLGQDFCKLIDSHVADNLAMIDSFGERDQLPQIAVSVDMMDTGIDVPDVLNLVFFKNVNSKIKFLQMVGRGTRLSPNVFGPGLDKSGFLIFDYYDNFNFFRTRNTWSTINEDSNGKSFSITPQTILLNERKLNILRQLIEGDYLTDFETAYRDRLKAYFIQSVRGLCNDDIEVQYNMPYISKYRTAEQWDGFTDGKIEEIREKILPLFPSDPSPVKVKNFDLMIYVIEDEVPKRAAADKDIRKIRHGFGNVGNKIDAMLGALTKLKTIPEIVAKEQTIQKMRNADFLFENFSLENCETIRLELRDLMQYIPDERQYYIIDAKDFVIDTKLGGGIVEKTYAEKVKDYLAKGTPALAKIRNLDMLTDAEKSELEDEFKTKMGSEADYASLSGNKPLLPYLRTQVGIADEAIRVKFGSFMNDSTLNPAQMTYMNQIVNYARENGDIVFLDLQRVSPFCDVDIMDLFGAKLKYIKDLINGLHHPVM